jgi:TatD DNase family protein
MTLELIDTHAHLDDSRFDDARDDVVSRAREAGVAEIVIVGTDLATSRRCVELAGRYERAFAAVGIQPNSCADATPGDWDAVVALTDAPGVVAIGETGLDKYWDFAPFDLQRDYFARHLRLGREKDLPVVIHLRDCDREALEMLREHWVEGPTRGVLHSFCCGEDVATECVAMGLYVSFSGMITYKKSDRLREIAATIPLDRTLVETDCPYLSPEPMRKVRPNEPALIRHTAECLARVHGLTLEELAARTTANARRLFFEG